MIDFKGHRFEKDIILTCVRWYLAYPLSYRNLEEMMEERGVEVDHSNIYRWVQKFTPQLESAFRKGQKRPVGNSWRMDETYIKIKGQWKYLYRAVDKAGQTVDFLLTARRDKKAALRFFKKAVGQHGLPEKVTIDKSGANTAALEALQEETGQAIEIRQIKYLNNLVEQDHRAIKRIVRPMLGFKTFGSARRTLRGIELMHMIKKGQMVSGGNQDLSAAGQFYSLAA
jgi:putative transposase